MTTTLPDALSDTTRAFVARDHGLLIDGERVPAADGATFATLDPATGQPVASVPAAGAADVDRAVGAAREAFEGWSQTPRERRAELLAAIGAGLGERGDEIAATVSAELGMPLKRGLMVFY